MIMKATQILAPTRMMPMIVEGLRATGQLHCLWEQADPDAFLRDKATDIGAIATGAHIRIDGAYMAQFPNLKVVANFGVGYDTVDAAWAGKHGIIVTNTPDVLTEEVADTAMGLLIMTQRELPQSERWLRSGQWEKTGPYPLTRNTLRGKTIGILALGRIGKAIAKRCEAFGLTIVYHGRNKQADVPYRYFSSLVEMAAHVDILMSVAPGGAETKHVINAEVLSALGPMGVVINIGRGSVIDETALIHALQNKIIFAAGLDVFEHEPHVPQALIACENAVLLPHVGSASIHTRNQMGQLVVDNILAYLDGKPPLTPVAETPFSGW
jgi:lactate dehydrogenase-like 2-hydroxyacid dehydrogenase